MSRSVSNNSGTSNATAASVALLAALATSGCSFLFSEGAPANHRAVESFSCGESYAPPIVDTVAAGLFAFEAIDTAGRKNTIIARTDVSDQPAERHALNVTIGLEIAAVPLATAAAIYGYHAVRDCREARDERLALVSRARLLPPPYGVPPIGAPPPLWPPPALPAPRVPPPVTPEPPPATPSP